MTWRRSRLVALGALACGAALAEPVRPRDDATVLMTVPAGQSRPAAGLRVAKLGTTSVTYEIGLFGAEDDRPAATGRFVHVWVERATNRPTAVPEKIRAAIAPLLVQAS